MRLAGALHFFWLLRDYRSEERDWLEQSLAHNLVEQFPGVDEKLARFFAMPLVVEDGGVAAPEFPGVEKRRPVDERDEVGESGGRRGTRDAGCAIRDA